MKNALISGTIIAAMAAILWFLLFRSDAEPTAITAPAQTTIDKPATESSSTPRGDRPRIPPPNLPKTNTAATTDTKPTIVRDHRSGTVVAPIPPAPKPPEKSYSMSKNVIIDFRQNVAPIVKQCEVEHGHSLGDLPERATLYTQIVVDIKDEQVSVTNTIASARDVPGAEALIDCVKKNVGAMDFSAAGQEDVEGYRFNMPFRLGQ